MSALVSVKWSTNALSLFRGSKTTSLTALIANESDGSKYWTTFFTWELGCHDVAEVELLVEEKEPDIFLPGAKIEIFRPDYSVLGEMTVLNPSFRKQGNNP